MQTFLPYPDFVRSARALDLRRLGKQRVEVLQLLNALARPADGRGWTNHPATRMWRGYESALAHYGLAVCAEWVGHGYGDTCAAKIAVHRLEPVVLPPWFGDPAFHAAHRSNLLRKDPAFYSRYGWAEDDSLPYVWPV